MTELRRNSNTTLSDADGLQSAPALAPQVPPEDAAADVNDFTELGFELLDHSVSPSDFAAEDLAAWQSSLDELRRAENQAEVTRRGPDVTTFYRSLRRVDEARDRAALLLAAAVAKKRSCGG